MEKDERLELIESIENGETCIFDYRGIEIEIDDNLLDNGNWDASTLVDNGIKFVDYFYDNRDKINHYIVDYVEKMNVVVEDKEELDQILGIPSLRMIDETIFTYEFFSPRLNMDFTLEVEILETGLELSYVTIND